MEPRHYLSQESRNDFMAASKPENSPRTGKQYKNLVVVPVTPIFSDAIIQETLDNYKSGPLIGLEYLIELLFEDKRMVYLCTQCIEKFEAANVIAHLSTFFHKKKYLMKFFPHAFGKFQSFGSVSSNHGQQICLDKMVEIIEIKCGRLKPIQVEAAKYKSHKSDYLRIIQKGQHIKERPEFDLIFNHEFFKQFKSTDKEDSGGKVPNQSESIKQKSANSRPEIKSQNTLEQYGDHVFCFVCNQYFLNDKHLEKKGHILSLRKSGYRNNDWMLSKSISEVPSKPIFLDSIIQEKLDNFKSSPLIGIEYLIELQFFTDDKQLYLCTLCLKRCDTCSVTQHLSSLMHMRKYMELYFPRSLKTIQKMVAKDKDGFRMCVEKLASIIEEIFGRLKPMPVEYEKYKYHSLFYLHAMRNGKHFTESESSIFETAFRNEFVADPNEYASKDCMLTNSMKKVDFVKSSEGMKPCDNEILSPSTTSISVHSSMPYANESRTRGLSQSTKTDIYGMKRDGQPSIATRAIKLEKFKKLSEELDEEMEQEFIKYDENPELHPQYDKEWKEFWKKRYMELKREGKDPSTYDFKPEWGKFWADFFLKLHQEKIKSKKAELRREFELDEQMPVPTGNYREVVMIDDDSDSMETSRECHRSKSPESTHGFRDITATYKDITLKTSPSCSRSSSQKDSLSCFEPALHQRDRNYPKTSPRGQSPIHERSTNSKKRSRSREKSCELSSERKKERNKDNNQKHWDHLDKNPFLKQDSKYPVNDFSANEVNVIAALRLLTAVEERLGSLGPKVIDLMSQALVMENKSANSSEALLDSESNCILLETTKEKLKGQLEGGLVDKDQHKLYVKIIGDIDMLISVSLKRKVNKSLEKLEVMRSGFKDKERILERIVNNVLSQGKKNVTQEELEQLIRESVSHEPAEKPMPMRHMGEIEYPQWSNNKNVCQSFPYTSLIYNQNLFNKIGDHQDRKKPTYDKVTSDDKNYCRKDHATSFNQSTGTMFGDRPGIQDRVNTNTNFQTSRSHTDETVSSRGARYQQDRSSPLLSNPPKTSVFPERSGRDQREREMQRNIRSQRDVNSRGKVEKGRYDNDRSNSEVRFGTREGAKDSTKSSADSRRGFKTSSNFNKPQVPHEKFRYFH